MPTLGVVAYICELNRLDTMFKILQKYNIRWLFISLFIITLSTGYLIWRQIHLELDIVLLSLFFVLVVALTLNLIFIIRAGRHLEKVEDRDNKVIRLLSMSEESILLTDTKGIVAEIYWNSGSERLLGNIKEEIQDINIFDLLDFSKEERRDIIYQLLDGEPLLNKIFSLVTNNEVSREVMVSIHYLVEPIGKFVFFLRDLDWFRKLHDEMLHTERMAGIGKLAADIAHQLNTPLGSILLSSQMLLDENNTTQSREDLEKIIRQTKRCKDVVKNLLDLSRKNEDEKIEFSLKPIIERSVDLLLIRFRSKGIKVEQELNPHHLIYGNPADLEQAFLNLMMNSIDAMPDGGILSIRTASYRNKQAIIYIEDSGKGIINEIQKKVFDPFFSTKKFGQGTGLGLAMSRQIIESHSGTIEISSEPGRGTMACIVLPMIMEKIQ